MHNSRNRFNNILLCTLPVIKADVRIPISPYCGIGYIAEAINRNRIVFQYLDLRFKNLADRLFDIIKRTKPDLIGTTMFTQGYKYSYNFLQQIKSFFPEIKIVVGGPHVSCFREEILKECSAIDYGISVEGDETIVDLCKGNPLETIKGLFYRDNYEVKYTGDRPFILDLDRLGFPQYEKFNLENYAVKSISISTSRGCFAQCTFCTVACTHGRKVRLRSAELVAQEISHWYQREYCLISIADDNFPVDRKRVFTICDILRSKKLKGLQIKFDNGVRADCVDEELLKAMFSVGFNKVSFGVESANEHILKNIKKGESLERIENAIRIALKVGMQVHLTFIIGLPGETEREVRNSFEFAKRMGVHNTQFYSLVPYPRSELFEWANKHNYLLYKPEDYLNFIVEPHKETSALIETLELSQEYRTRLFAEGQGVRRHIERRQQVKLLEPKVGKLLAKLLILIYTNNYFEKLFERSFILKRYIFKLRFLLNI